MNILYIGSSGALSLTPFKQLLSSEHSVSAVGVFNPVVINHKIIALENESLSLAANQAFIPVIDLSKSISDIYTQCENIAIDVILMSCYSRRLPEEIINLASKGCFNMHPSLLPRFRGPEPIFWQMKAGSEMGVSWHRVVHDYDAGDIVAQKKVVLDDGIDFLLINLALANTGGALMKTLLSDLSVDSLSERPQEAELVSYFPYPAKHDFVVDTAWSAQHAYNFMRATQVFGHPYLCQIGSHRYLLNEAVDYVNNDCLQAAEVNGDQLYIPCYEGVLIATFTAKL